MPNLLPYEFVIKIVIEEQVDKDSESMNQLSLLVFNFQYDTVMSNPRTTLGIGLWQSSSSSTANNLPLPQCPGISGPLASTPG